jgi:hypothetical protein
VIGKANLRAVAVATLPLVLLPTGCAGTGADPTASRSPAPKTSVKPPAPGPSYADVTQGDSSTAALLSTFDAAAHSAVIEPVIFNDGPSFCKTYRIKSSDERCQHDWVLVQSHQRVAVPVSPDVKLFTAFSDTEDCAGSIAKGGSCPVSTAKFAAMAAADKKDFLVHVTLKAGTVTRIAEEFRP